MKRFPGGPGLVLVLLGAVCGACEDDYEKLMDDLGPAPTAVPDAARPATDAATSNGGGSDAGSADGGALDAGNGADANAADANGTDANGAAAEGGAKDASGDAAG